MEIHSIDTILYVCTGDKVSFTDKRTWSKPANKSGSVDLYLTRMLAELYGFCESFDLVYMEKNQS